MVDNDIIDDALRKNMEAFDGQADWLAEHHNGKFVIYCEATFVASFDTFDAAAREAIRRFGQGPYLIRQVGCPREFPMPASVAFSRVRAAVS